MTRARILVTGSRDWTDAWLTIFALETVRARFQLPPILVNGYARGADRYARTWWYREHGPGSVDDHPADWGRYGRQGGPLRNQKMVDLGADLCIAFPLPDSVGTWDCAARAHAAGIRVEIAHREANGTPTLTLWGPS